jgi:hypothetical protein
MVTDESALGAAFRPAMPRPYRGIIPGRFDCQRKNRVVMRYINLVGM